MKKITLPGRAITMEIKYLLLDLNGTLSVDGVLIEGVKERIELLKQELVIYLLTADTMGKGRNISSELGIELYVVDADNGRENKSAFMHKLGAGSTAAIGNGYNDISMLQEAGLSIAVIGPEGCCSEALTNSDIVVYNVLDALDLLLKPLRIIATLRG